MNLENIEKIVKYIFSKGVDQVSVTITKVEENEFHYSIDSIKNKGDRYVATGGYDFTLNEAMIDWNKRHEQQQ